MWVDKTRVYAAKAIDNEYAYGRLNAGDRGINAIYKFIRFFLLYCNFLPTGSREEPNFFKIFWEVNLRWMIMKNY